MTSAGERLKISRFTTQIVIPSEHLEDMPHPCGGLCFFLVLLRIISGVHPGCSHEGLMEIRSVLSCLLEISINGSVVTEADGCRVDPCGM